MAAKNLNSNSQHKIIGDCKYNYIAKIKIEIFGFAFVGKTNFEKCA